MKQTQSAQLSSQMNVEDPTSSNSIIVSREQYEDSPLSICSIEEETKWFLALGTKRLTEYKDTKEEILALLEKKPWDLIILITVAVAEDTINYMQREAFEKAKSNAIKNSKTSL